MTLLWQAKSLQDFTRLELVRPEQAQDLGNGRFRAEVKFGDVVPGMTEQRSLWDISQLAFREGDECAIALRMTLDSSWIGWFPKNDELANWPGTPNVGTGKGGIAGGSFLEFHHAPNDGNWANLKPGSAPFYFGANADNWRAYLLETDPKSPNFGGPRAAGTWLRPLHRGTETEFVIHALWSVDPAKGWIEIDADGAQWVPRFQSATLYPNTFVYPQVGIYRRDFIGDPALTWPMNAQSGKTGYGEFIPQQHARVFPRNDGYPQSVQFADLRIGRTKEDVMATSPVPNPTQPAAPTPTAPANFDATKPSVNPNAGAEQLMATRDALKAQIDAINALLSKGAYRP